MSDRTNHIRNQINAAIEQVKAAGWNVVGGIWLVPEMNACCPLSACYLADKLANHIPFDKPSEEETGEWFSYRVSIFAIEQLGMCGKEIDAFVNGVDGKYPIVLFEGSEEFYRLGQEICVQLGSNQ